MLLEDLPNTLEQTIVMMQTIVRLMKAHGLPHIVAFAWTYLVLTQAVQRVIATQKAGGDKVFRKPDLIEHLMIVFAHYYFEALRDWLDGKKVASPWAYLFGPKARKLPAVLCIALGALAHIRFDLYRAVAKAGMSRLDLADFLRVNLTIRRVLEDEVMKRFYPPHPAMLVPIASMVFYSIIWVWRLQAWRDFRLLEWLPEWLVMRKVSIKCALVATIIYGIGRIIRGLQAIHLAPRFPEEFPEDP